MLSKGTEVRRKKGRWRRDGKNTEERRGSKREKRAATTQSHLEVIEKRKRENCIVIEKREKG